MQIPRPHQTEAIRACVAGLKRKGARGQCIMACGTGKTLVGYEVAKGLKVKRVLVLVPSLLLVNQMIREYRTFGAQLILSVCSEDTDSGEDVIRVSVKDLEIDNTTNATAAKKFLEGDGDRIVVSTYQSLRALSEVFGELSFDLAVFDEAHKTAGARSKMFGHGLSDDHVKCARRLFLTATPRHAELKDDGEEAQVYAMNDPKVYGPVIYSLPLRAAIEAGIIDDYRIIIALVDGDVGELGDQAVRVAIDQAMKTYGIRKVFTFHTRVAEAEGFILGATDTLKGARLYHVNGNQSSAERGLKLEGFAAAEAALMTNAQCLTEGVDLPAADMVAFLSRKKSPIGIVQAVGRVLRKHHSKAKGGFVFIPVFVRPGQDEEAAIAESDWRGVYEVLQAMREHDKPLTTALSRCARGERELPEQLLIMDGRKRELEGDVVGRSESMRMAIRVKAVRPFGRGSEYWEEMLMEMASSGSPRPHRDSPEGVRLRAFTSKSHGSYRPELTKLLRQKAPAWWQSSRGYSRAERGLPPRPVPKWRKEKQRKKLEIEELARFGGQLPKRNTSLGDALRNYTYARSSSFDPKWSKKIRHLAPHWFTKSKGNTQ